MNLRIIGIDLAVSAKHKAIILDPAENQFIGGQITFRARPSDLDRLLRLARTGAPDNTKLKAVLEATGMAWYPVAAYLEQHGVDVFRINGQKTKDFRRALWKHTGSDQIDSRVLARLFQIAPDRLSRCPLPSGDLLTLQRACRAHAHWREQDTAVQNRMKAIDQWAWDGLTKLVPKQAQSWVRTQWYNPWRVREMGAAALTAAWSDASAPKEVKTDWIPRWVDRADQMTALYGSPLLVGYDHLQATMRDAVQSRRYFAQMQEKLASTLIEPLYLQLFPNCHLLSIKGIGLSSAATYHAFIQDINRFPSVAEFRLWCGIVPRSKQSGDAESKGLSITKSGPNLVKATLYINAEVARQWDVQIAAVYHRQMVEYGKHHLQAVCACASHLASRIYAVLKQNRPYQLCDLQGEPISAYQSHMLSLQLKVPDHIRQRNNKRFRRNKAQQDDNDRLD